ncbi:MAG TPA: NAD(P)H-dependent oxidoreductase [Alphaproteobacteria bacterium]|jgi:chromate reductase
MKIFAFAGSLRAGSYNRKLIAVAVANARAAGADVELGDFRDYCPPHYDGDAEAAAGGLPKEALALVEKVDAADGLIIATPEYNNSIPGPLKNAIDWLSRPRPYRLAGKPVLMIGAAGRSGCKHVFPPLRVTLEFQGAKVHAQSFGLEHCNAAFTPEGQLIEAALANELDAIIKAFLSEIKA